MSTSITLEGFYRKAGKLIPWFMSAALVLFVVGVYLGFFVCPIEARQGNSYRIIFIHIPAAWLAMSLYLLMAVASIVGLLKNSRLAFILAQAMAPTGALMGFIALFSGAFWADVGHILGVGCSPDIHADSLLPLSRLYCAPFGH